MSTPKFPTAKAKLVGEDGNAFNLMGIVIKALRKTGATDADVRQFQDEAMSGDYNNLLRTCSEWVEVS